MQNPPRIRYKILLLPPLPDACPVCAAVHAPQLPHNPASLYYQFQFYRENSRWPTWADATAHCCEDVRNAVLDAVTIEGK